MSSAPTAPPPTGRPAWVLTAAIVVGALVVTGLVLLVVELTTRGPDARPELAQPLVPPAPTDPAERRRWADETAGATGVPARALAAYGAAEVANARERPSCGLSWVTLAGIGRVESNHARFGGAELGEDGRSDPPIRGPQLDGTGGNRTITDTDGGRLDGDTSYDRAVGPMQFIPETWERLGTGGDPDVLDDAAVAAAAYLCDGVGEEPAERDVRRGDDWRAAVLAYNYSGSYVDRVHREASGYARAVSAP